MRAGLSDFYAELERAPEDWSVRIRLIEAALASGDVAEAKRLVRESPDPDRYLPGELQDRIHDLFTKRRAENVIRILPRADDGFPMDCE